MSNTIIQSIFLSGMSEIAGRVRWNVKFPLDYEQCPRDLPYPIRVSPVLAGCDFHFARTTIPDEMLKTRDYS